MALVMMLPVGISLALIGGYATLPDGWAGPAIVVAWVASLAWLFLVVKLYGGASPGLTKLDYAIRYVVIAALLIAAVASFMGRGPVSPKAPWLAVKLVVFAGIIVCGLGIRVVFKPFAMAFGKLVTEGSSPAVEAAMKQAQTRVRPVVLTLWVGLIVEAFLGLSKL
jgi:sorbitol-specific phosphotransferase system component IIC